MKFIMLMLLMFLNVALLLPGCGNSDSPAIATPAPPPENRYAVIISGGGLPAENGERYWNDVSFFYTTLKKNGIPDANIYVIMSDGTDPTFDGFSTGGSYSHRFIYWYFNSNPDLDGDGQPDVRYSATKANIASVFNEVVTRVGANDILYIFTTGHGSPTADNSGPYNVSLGLRGDEIITADELAALLDRVRAKATVGIFEQCNAGGFVEKMAAPGRVLMSASRWWETSRGGAYSFPYDPFAYYATLALSDSAKGNTNGDGPSTMEGAYLYAMTRDNYNEHPSYYSNPWDLGRKLTLQGSAPTLAAPVYAGFSETESGEIFPPLGQAQGWHADDAFWSWNLPFVFPFGPNRYETIHVSSNGIIYFSAPSSSGSHGRSEMAASVATAPLWSDLTTADLDSDIFIDSAARQVTIAWRAKTKDGNRPVNVAARLQDKGVITFYYGEGNDFTNQDKTIGLSPGDGTVLYSLRNGASSLGGARAVTFTPAGR